MRRFRVCRSISGVTAFIALAVLAIRSHPLHLQAQSRPFVPREAVLTGRLMAPYTEVQSASATLPRFEVASIKQADPSARPGRAAAALGVRINTSPGMLSTRSVTLKDLIAAAYAIETYQVTGGPGWLDSERFEVLAKSADATSREQLLLMLRPLLADRFRFTFHRETKEMRVYALTVAKNGSLRRMKPGEESKPVLNRLGRDWDMPALARYLTGLGADMPVIDKTGLTGQFNLDLDMEKIIAAAAEIGGTPPSNEGMYQGTVAIMERQCGLKLVPSKAPIELLVVDGANRPSAN
jgi:uncharacterized protein (TIGR03435 family)